MPTSTDQPSGSEPQRRPQPESRAKSRPAVFVRRASGADLQGVVSVLVKAFDDDPVSRFMFGESARQDANRALGLKRFFSIQLRHGFLDQGEVWAQDAGDGVFGGAAIWAPPSMPRPGLGDLLNLLPALPCLIRGGHLVNGLRLLSEVERARPKEPHWYLATVGADPARQGRGIGSALISAVLEKVDQEAMPAYLESSKERNIPLYRRFGFEVTGEVHARGGGPTLWLMWREPRPPA